VRRSGQATGVGAVAGGVLGGVLGRQLGGSSHRTAGTVVGAAGGAVAGHMIEKKARSGKTFEIGVRFDDGRSKTFTQDTHPSWKTGDRVRVEMTPYDLDKGRINFRHKDEQVVSSPIRRPQYRRR